MLTSVLIANRGGIACQIGRTARRLGRPTVILQLSSGAAESPYPGWSGYCSAKAAVEMWVKTVAVEIPEGDDLVRVAAVRPGIVATEMQAEIRSSTSAAFPNVERFRDLYAGGHLADPGQVAQARAHAGHTQGVTLRQPPRLAKPYQLAPCRYGHHFFRSASRATSFSSTDSANSFFSRAFSVSSSFSRLASDTDIPPNLDFHR